MILKNCIEFCYRPIDENNRFKFFNRDVFNALVIIVLLGLYFAVSKPVDNIVDARHSV